MANEFVKVCVGIDGSEDAETALEWAARFAEGHDCRVQPIHTWEYPPVGYSPWPAGVPMPPESSLSDAAERLAVESFEHWKASTHNTEQVDPPDVKRGSTAATLIESSSDADLLVVGSRGLGAVRGLIIGSVSSYCAAHASCPVAIVPMETGGRRVNKIVVGYDGTEQAAAALAWTVDAYPGTTVEIVNVWHLPTTFGPLGMPAEYDLFERNAISIVERAKDNIEARASETGCEITSLAVLGDARMELNRRAEDADLLVIGVQAAHGLRRIFMGSVAQSVVHHISVPTVIVPVPS